MARALRIAVASSLLLLGACASVPRQAIVTLPWSQRLAALQAIAKFELRGRIAASNASDGFSAGLRWQQDQDLAIIDLTAALGFGAAHIEQSEQQLQVTTSNGTVLQGSAATEALAASLGFEPPLKSLRYWILGASDPALAAQESLDAQQRLTRLQQGGWQVDYDDYERVQQQWLPRRVSVTREALRLRLVINTWQL